MRVYFFIAPHGPATRANYDHQSIALAEGLRGRTEISGNISFWPLLDGSQSNLIEPQVFEFRDSDIVVFSSEIFDGGFRDLLPSDLYSSTRKYKLVFLDSSDGLITPGFRPEMRNVDIVLKSHFNLKYDYPSNFLPWQFGLTNRLIEYARRFRSISRKDVLVESFRVNHGARALARRCVLPRVDTFFEIDQTIEDFNEHESDSRERELWTITGRRHYSSYFQRLGSSLACAAFGGHIEPSWMFGDTKLRSRLIKLYDLVYCGKKSSRVWQWDSYRLWESLISGCGTLLLDLERYGAVLPVMPRKFEHYVGIDFDNIDAAITILSDRQEVARIGEAGQKWAWKHYNPVAIADRFLSILNQG